MSNFKINERPASIGYFTDAGENDCAITIQTDKGQLLGLTRADTQKLIDVLTSTLESFDCAQEQRGGNHDNAQ